MGEFRIIWYFDGGLTAAYAKSLNDFLVSENYKFSIRQDPEVRHINTEESVLYFIEDM